MKDKYDNLKKEIHEQQEIRNERLEREKAEEKLREEAA